MVYDSIRGVTVLFGGYAAGGNGETWEWDGATWQQRKPAASPSARDDHMMAFDSARGVTVLFGGSTGGNNNGETWEWDGTNWSQRNPVNAPSARQEHAMAYDSLRGVAVLFGGYDGARDGETWEWDGTNWTQRFPSNSPSARYDHAMAYDSARGVTVLFGGDEGGGETWEWNGTNWSLRPPPVSPSPRRYHAMAYDSTRHITVLFGSGNGETWEWDGVTWAQRLTIPAPSDRSDHAMVHDSARGVTVMFGGDDPQGVKIAQTWEWAGPRPALLQQPAGQAVAPGQTASFSVAASGMSPLTYRWRRDGTPLADGGVIAGATTPVLTVSPAAMADEASYTCLVSSPCGDTLSRGGALVVDECIAPGVTGDCDANGILDECEIAEDATLDADDDGDLDSCEETGNGPAGGAQTPADCGACGGGAPAMMPIMALGLMCGRRRLQRRVVPRSRVMTGNSFRRVDL